MHLLTLGFSLVAALLGACALAALARGVQLKVRGVAAEGRVVGHAHEPDGTRAAAIVEYVVADVAYRVRAGALHAHADAEVGAPLSVLYVRDQPKSARVATTADVFTPAYALAVAFAAIGGLAGGLLYVTIALR